MWTVNYYKMEKGKKKNQEKKKKKRNITLDPRLPFPGSVGGIFPIRVLNDFLSWRGYTMIDSFEHVDEGDNTNINK